LDLLWPDYDAKELLLDTKYFLHISVSKMAKITDSVDTKLKTIKNFTKLKSWLSFANQIVKDNEDSFLRENPPPVKYKDEEVLLYDYTKLNIKELYENMISRGIEIYELIIKRLHVKYLICKDTAKAWMEEYFKFMCIFTVKLEVSFPSKCVENVWNTHMEFTKEYRKFSVRIFNKVIYPHIYELLEEGNDDLPELYRATLNTYEDLFCAKPPELYWESEEVRFQEDKMRVV
jgi:hypothetical protein